MGTTRSRWVAVLGTAMLALLLVACGGDDSDDDASSAGTAPSEQGESDDSGGDNTAEDAVIVIEGSAFDVQGPAPAGEVVLATNNDSITHTVTADDGDFDVEVPGGSTESLGSVEAGTYAFHCEIHPSMTGELVVE